MKKLYASPDMFRVISIDGRPLNPRGNTGDTSVLQADINRDGQQVPVQVITCGVDECFYLISGHRRLAACKALGIDVAYSLIKHIPSWDDLIGSKDEIVAMMATANNYEPMAEVVVSDGEIVAGKASVAKTLADAGWTLTSIAAKLGYASYDSVSSLVSLYDASEKVVAAVANGALGLTVYGRFLRKLEPDEQDHVLLLAASYSFAAIQSAYQRWLQLGDTPQTNDVTTDPVIDDPHTDTEEEFEPDVDPYVVLGEIDYLARQIRFIGRELKPMERSRLNKILEMLGAVQ